MTKKVGFAAEPKEDLRQHHQKLKEIEEEKKKFISFHKIPPELKYLDRLNDPGPKPLPSYKPETKQKPYKPLGNLKKCHVKDLSVVNKNTEVNFNYPTIELPINPYNLLVQVSYASLNSCDIAKINKYYYNLSDSNIGLGYEFSGEIIDIGSKVNNGFALGDKVFGCVDPSRRTGSLSTTLLISPEKDYIVKIDDDVYKNIKEIEPLFKINRPKPQGTNDNSINQDIKVIELPTLAKFSIFPALYCRAQQALQHLKNLTLPVILINGADTNLGYTIIQILNSSMYDFENLTLIMIAEDNNVESVEDFVSQYEGIHKNFKVIEFNLETTDIVLPGERIPVNFKKPDLMAINLFEAMFKQSSEVINANNVNNYRFDLIVDIIGSNWLTKTSIKYKKLDYLKLPVKFEAPLSSLLIANKDPFLTKLLKPKSMNSSFVSFCKFNTKNSSYSIDELVNYKTQSNEESILNLWSNSWTSNIANTLSNYRYFDEINIKIRRDWLVQGLQLFQDNEIKFKVDEFFDWNQNFRDYYKKLRTTDAKIVLKIEKF